MLLAALFAGGHAVTAVGDPCQSIYGWRGASSGTLRRFPSAFGASGPASHLSTTYRSGGRVLLLANAVARDLRREGVPVPDVVSTYMRRGMANFVRRAGEIEEIDNARATFGEGPGIGEIFRNPDLARTYRMIAEGGRDAYYDGPIAATIESPRPDPGRSEASLPRQKRSKS